MAGSFVIAAGKIALNQQRWRGYMTGIRAKDSGSLAQLYDETSSVLYGLALRMLNNPAQAEEVMLNVYRQTWDSPAVDGENVLESLILRTRSQALERIRQGGAAVLQQEKFAQTDGAAAGDGVKTLEGLTSEECEVVELAFFRGLNAAEMASALGASVATIKSRICAGTGKLRDALRDGSQGNVH